MAAESRAALKTYYETDDQPTATEFGKLIDSFFSIIDDGYTGSGEVVMAIGPTLDQPDIADFSFALHDHQDAAGGGTLDAAAIGSGTLDNGRVKWAEPGAIGGTTPAAGAFTSLTCTADRIKMGPTGFTPASSAAPGNEGDICFDANYLYYYRGGQWHRVGSNTW